MPVSPQSDKRGTINTYPNYTPNYKKGNSFLDCFSTVKESFTVEIFSGFWRSFNPQKTTTKQPKIVKKLQKTANMYNKRPNNRGNSCRKWKKHIKTQNCMYIRL